MLENLICPQCENWDYPDGPAYIDDSGRYLNYDGVYCSFCKGKKQIDSDHWLFKSLQAKKAAENERHEKTRDYRIEARSYLAKYLLAAGIIQSEDELGKEQIAYRIDQFCIYASNAYHEHMIYVCLQSDYNEIMPPITYPVARALDINNLELLYDNTRALLRESQDRRRVHFRIDSPEYKLLIALKNYIDSAKYSDYE